MNAKIEKLKMKRLFILVALALYGCNPVSPPQNPLIGVWIAHQSYGVDSMYLNAGGMYRISKPVMPAAGEYGTWTTRVDTLVLHSIPAQHDYQLTYQLRVDTLTLCRDTVCEVDVRVKK